MSWQREVDELRLLEGLAEEMGGPEKVARQKARGRPNVRQRLAALVDPGSLHEIGKIAGSANLAAPLRRPGRSAFHLRP